MKIKDLQNICYNKIKHFINAFQFDLYIIKRLKDSVILDFMNNYNCCYEHTIVFFQKLPNINLEIKLQ